MNIHMVLTYEQICDNHYTSLWPLLEHHLLYWVIQRYFIDAFNKDEIHIIDDVFSLLWYLLQASLNTVSSSFKSLSFRGFLWFHRTDSRNHVKTQANFISSSSSCAYQWWHKHNDVTFTVTFVLTLWIMNHYRKYYYKV